MVAAFGLAGPVAGWDPVGGAWSNRVFRLEAAGRRYAVKEMRNPWADPHWEQWLAEAWVFERRAMAAGVAAPQPVPDPASGSCLAWVSRRDPALGDAAVRVHHWVAGNPAGPGPVTADTARWAGQTLATLHGLRIRPRDRSLFPVPNTETARRWPELAEAAQRSGRAVGPPADRSSTGGGDDRGTGHVGRLPARPGSDHTRRYRPEEPHHHQRTARCCATGTWPSPLVPRRELADVAMSLGCWENFAISRQVLRSYRQAGGDSTPIGPSDLGPAPDERP